MNKKVYSLLLATTVITTSVTSVLGFGGTYPVHPQYETMTQQITLRKQSGTPSDSDYIFSVGGKKFILLDKDVEGNYFVMTDDLYGKHAFDTTYADKPVIKTRKQNGTYIDGPAYDVDDNEWMFDTTDPDNIGYWLNNDFLANGNGEGNMLPDEIKNNIVEYTWQVEGMKAARDWTANMHFDSKHKVTYANDFAKSKVTEPYQVTGKLSLMSHTEYLQYQDIIGFIHGDDLWKGFMLRTPHALVTGNKDTQKEIYYTYGETLVKNGDAGSSMCMFVDDIPSKVNMFVRPVMWLDKDFFKNVKIDIATAGKYEKEELSKLTFEELISTYSLDDIKSLKTVTVPAPQITEAKIHGTAAVGSTLSLDYKFTPYTGGAEKDSEIYWLEKSEEGYKVVATNSKKYIVEKAGTVIECAIIPKDESGACGTMVVAGSGVTGIKAKSFILSDMVVTDEKVTVKFTVPEGEDANARLICVVHDENNKLVSVSAKDVVAENDMTEEIALFPKNAGESVTVMILAKDNQPVLVIKK